MMLKLALVAVAGLAAGVLGHGDRNDEKPIAGPHKSLWYNTLPGDGGTQVCFITGYRAIVWIWLTRDRPTPSSLEFPPLDAYHTSPVSPATTRSTTLHS